MNIRKYFDDKLVKTIVIIAAIVLSLEYGTKIMEVVDYALTLLSPFILGASMAFVMNVPMRSIEKNLFTSKKTGKKYKGARALSILCTVLAIVSVILVVIFMIVPEMAKTTGTMVDSMSNFSLNIQEYMDKVAVEYPDLRGYIDKIDLDWAKISETALNFLKSGLGGIVNSTVNVVGSIIFGFVNFIIGFVFAIYIIFSKEELSKQGKKLCYSFMKPAKADRLIQILQLSNQVFSNFLSGQCVEACILGFMFFITMSLIDLPYALLIGVLIAFTALIPIFGAFIGCVIATFLIVAVSPIQAVIFLVLFMILQQLEENLIYPHVVGNSVGLPSIWVLVAVTLGGSLMGVVGMLIFIPIASIIYTLLGENMNERLKKRGIPESKWKVVEEEPVLPDSSHNK